MNRTNTFNTRRAYGPTGQRIAVQLLSHDPETCLGVVALADADRGLHITLRVFGLTERDCVTQEYVMRAYDSVDRISTGLHWEAEKELYEQLYRAARACTL